ncbi:MAG: helix-turn-helix domain-containing protein [Desulfobacterales bacterium]
MHQKPTIINAEELFGNFSDPGEFQNMADGVEKNWEWPEEIGSGFMYIIKFRPGLMLGIGDYQLWKNLTVGFEAKISSFVMGFSIPVNVWSTPGNGQGKKDVLMFNSGQSFISYLPEWQGIAEYPARTPVRSVGIYIDPLLLNTFLDGQHDRFPADMHDIVNGSNEKHYYHSLTTTPLVNMAIHQILNCPYQGSLRRLYLESKTLELIAHNLAQLIVDKNGHNRPFTLLPSDIERVREAGDVLIHNLENPPSLLELARQVGINKNKLNQGFQQVFGNSVFEYLRIRRLERARELLESKEKNVTEAAFEVGYAQQSNFTKAFKRHFGINPTYHLR